MNSEIILFKKPLIRAFNMDCMIFMRNIPDKYFNLCICDPPYGIGRDKGFEGFGGFGKPIARKKYKGNWDSKPPPKKYFDELLRITKNAMIFGGNFYTNKLPQSNHWIFWDKLNTMPTFGDGELIWTNIKRNSVKKYTKEYNGLLGKEDIRLHSCQKPIALYRWLLKNYAKPGDKIFDTHGGSMSSAIACALDGFEMDIIEIDADYFNSAIKRFKEQTCQMQLF